MIFNVERVSVCIWCSLLLLLLFFFVKIVLFVYFHLLYSPAITYECNISLSCTQCVSTWLLFCRRCRCHWRWIFVQSLIHCYSYWDFFSRLFVSAFSRCFVGWMCVFLVVDWFHVAVAHKISTRVARAYVKILRATERTREWIKWIYVFYAIFLRIIFSILLLNAGVCGVLCIVPCIQIDWMWFLPISLAYVCVHDSWLAITVAFPFETNSILSKSFCVSRFRMHSTMQENNATKCDF